MNCIIIDDEPLARKGMELLVGEYTDIQILGSFSNAMDARQFLNKNNVDLLFLDINMPEVTGLEMLKTLITKPLVIITTAYPQYALDSYELDVIDYLVKPIRTDRFLKAIGKAEYQYELRKQTEMKASKSDASSQEDFIFVKTGKTIVKVNFEDILYIEGLKDYVLIFTSTEKIIAGMNMKAIEAQLPASHFKRINKSYIINILHIKSIENDSLMIGGKELTIGKIFKDEFYQEVIEKNLLKR